jgi:hypothetical protein
MAEQREWRRVAPEPGPEARRGGWLARRDDPERLPVKDYTGGLTTRPQPCYRWPINR